MQKYTSTTPLESEKSLPDIYSSPPFSRFSRISPFCWLTPLIAPQISLVQPNPPFHASRTSMHRELRSMDCKAGLDGNIIEKIHCIRYYVPIFVCLFQDPIRLQEGFWRLQGPMIPPNLRHFSRWCVMSSFLRVVTRSSMSTGISSRSHLILGVFSAHSDRVLEDHAKQISFCSSRRYFVVKFQLLQRIGFAFFFQIHCLSLRNHTFPWRESFLNMRNLYPLYDLVMKPTPPYSIK